MDKSCELKDKVLCFLNGELGERESTEMEEHIQNCPKCSAMVEGYMAGSQSVAIPKQTFQGEDKELKEQVVCYEKGTARIVIFTIVGMIMGWFSRIYVTQEFFLIKLVLCVPYKISEIIYRTLGGWNAKVNFSSSVVEYWRISGYDMFGIFPFQTVISAMAEYLTPVLIGGAIYGSLAYFTGDKRIFTLTKYLKFGVVWLAVIGLYVGGVFGAYHISMENMNGLKGVQEIRIWTENGAEYYAFDKAQVEEILSFEVTEELSGQEFQAELHFKVNSLPCRINLEEKYLRTFGGKVYRLSQESLRRLSEWEQTGTEEALSEEVQQ